MNITIIEHKELKRVVSARELYEFLEVKTPYHKWTVRNNEYLDFQENVNYTVTDKFVQNPNPLGGRPSKEYFYTLDAAKEISMLQRTKKGREARQYFIECERKLKEQQLTIPNFSNPYEAALAWAEEYKAKQLVIEERDHAIKTKAWIGDKREATAMATASVATRKVIKLENEVGELKNELGRGRDYKQAKAVGWAKDHFDVKMSNFWSIFGKFLTKFCIINGYEVKQIDDPQSRHEKVNLYPVEGLEKVKDYLVVGNVDYEYKFMEKYRIDKDRWH